MNVHKRPSEMTAAEIDALPLGPFPEPAGAVVRANPVYGNQGFFCQVYKQGANSVRGDDLMAYAARHGRTWEFGQWSNGQWFKQRVR